MNYLVIVKKERRIYIWVAVDRNRNKVIDFEVSEDRGFRHYLVLGMRIKERYRVAISCSDHYEVYNKYHIGSKHICSKAETSLVESFNARIRHYLARFNRRTLRYSKAIDMIQNSILLLFNKQLIHQLNH